MPAIVAFGKIQLTRKDRAYETQTVARWGQKPKFSRWIQLQWGAVVTCFVARLFRLDRLNVPRAHVFIIIVTFALFMVCQRKLATVLIISSLILAASSLWKIPPSGLLRRWMLYPVPGSPEPTSIHYWNFAIIKLVEWGKWLQGIGAKPLQAGYPKSFKLSCPWYI